MSPLGRETSSLERRLKELQKEEELLRKDMRSLNRILSDPEEAIKKSTEQKPPSLFRKYFQRQPKAEPPAEPPPAQEPEFEPEPEILPPTPPPFRPEPEPPPEIRNDYPPAPPSDPEPNQAWRREGAEKKQRLVDGKFATYITAGSFMPAAASTRRTKPVQRNRAIFMVVVLIAALVIVMQLFRFFEW